MSFEKKMPVGGQVNKKEEAVSAKDLKAELVEDYKNFKDPNFYFPGGKSELEKAILEKEKQLLILENNINNVSAEGPVIKIEDQDSIENLKAELVEDYKNFKDPNFYFPGGKSEFEKLILEKENRLRSLEGNSIVNKLKVELKEDYNNFKDPNFYFPGGKSELEKSILEKEGKLRRGENMGRTGRDDSYEQSIKQSEEASPINPEMAIEENLGEGAEELSEPEFDLEPEVLLGAQQDFSEEQQYLSEEELDEQPEDLNEQGEEQLEENQEQRGRVFEFINKHPKLKWAAAAIGVLMIGVGVGRIAEGAISDSKEIDKKEIVKPGMEPDAPEIPVINIGDEIIKDGLIKNGIDISQLNPDVLDTILEEVGFISGAETLDSGDRIGEITKTVENGFKNIMPGKTKVNLIDDQTGAIYRDQEASSILVHPGDIVLENSDGEYFVIADKAGLNYEKLAGQMTDSVDTPESSLQTPEAETSKTVGGEVQSPEKEVVPSTKVEKVAGGEINNPGPLVPKKAAPSLEELEAGAVDLSAQVRETRANNNQEAVASADSDETSAEKVKEKKGFWKRIFGSGKAEKGGIIETEPKAVETSNSPESGIDLKSDSLESSQIESLEPELKDPSNINNPSYFFYKKGNIDKENIKFFLGEEFKDLDIRMVSGTAGANLPYFENLENRKAAIVLFSKNDIILVESPSLSKAREMLDSRKGLDKDAIREAVKEKLSEDSRNLQKELNNPSETVKRSVKINPDGSFSIEEFKKALGDLIM